MSFEKFPIKEKAATNIDTQLGWLVREMGYSRDKTKGYEEKLVRLAREPDDTQSVFGFMSNYWHRFRQANGAVRELPKPLVVSIALQANAKVVAGLCDKVAFAQWLQGKTDTSTETVDPEWLLDTALEAVRERVGLLEGTYTDEELLAYNDEPFEVNPMGKAILGLHQSYQDDPYDIANLHSIALEGSAMGVLMWQAYARSLEQSGFSSVMPRPGLSSGNIESWD